MMLNEWEERHLKSMRKIPTQKRFITLSRIVAEKKLLAKASRDQQVRLYGFYLYGSKRKAAPKVVRQEAPALEEALAMVRLEARRRAELDAFSTRLLSERELHR